MKKEDIVVTERPTDKGVEFRAEIRLGVSQTVSTFGINEAGFDLRAEVKEHVRDVLWRQYRREIIGDKLPEIIHRLKSIRCDDLMEMDKIIAELNKILRGEYADI